MEAIRKGATIWVTTRSEAMRDAEALAEDLAKHGILVISEQPIAKPGLPVQEQPQP